MKNNRLKLTESQLQNMIQKAVVKVLKEGTFDSDVADKWNWAVENVGAEAMLSELYNWLSHDEMIDFLNHLERNEYLDGYNMEDEYDEMDDVEL